MSTQSVRVSFQVPRQIQKESRDLPVVRKDEGIVILLDRALSESESVFYTLKSIVEGFELVSSNERPGSDNASANEVSVSESSAWSVPTAVGVLVVGGMAGAAFGALLPLMLALMGMAGVAGGAFLGYRGIKSATIKAKMEKEFYPLVHQLECSIDKLNEKWPQVTDICNIGGRKCGVQDRRTTLNCATSLDMDWTIFTQLHFFFANCARDNPLKILDDGKKFFFSANYARDNLLKILDDGKKYTITEITEQVLPGLQTYVTNLKALQKWFTELC